MSIYKNYLLIHEPCYICVEVVIMFYQDTVKLLSYSGSVWNHNPIFFSCSGQIIGLLGQMVMDNNYVIAVLQQSKEPIDIRLY